MSKFKFAVNAAALSTCAILVSGCGGGGGEAGGSVKPAALTMSLAQPVCSALIDVTVVCDTPTTNFVPVSGATLAFSASNLPASMSINAATGVASGVPPDGTLNASLVGASINITALATYSDGTTSTASATLSASGNPPWPQYGAGAGFVTAISATGIPDHDSLALRGFVHAGAPFTAVVTGVTDGLAGDVYAYSLVASSDSSFTIDPVTGTVSGTAPATPTIFNFSVVTTTTRQGKTYTWRNDIALGTE